ncbi:hypothetical protein CVE34_20820, partial [Pseudomonas syringae pv. actinidiae]|nr:hypothetical protein [Pseudomonas syringae pv. actinidiae]
GAARHCVACAIAEKNAFFQLSCDAPRRMPFWTLRVLFMRSRASPTAFPRWSVGNDNLNHTIIVRRSASHAVLDALRPLL